MFPNYGCRIAELENQLNLPDRNSQTNAINSSSPTGNSAELQDELHVVKRSETRRKRIFHEFTEKNQEQVTHEADRCRLCRMVVDVRSLLDAMPPELKAILMAISSKQIAEQPNEILKCAMYLFLGYLDGATQFAQSCGGGGWQTARSLGDAIRMKMTAASPTAA